MAARYGHGHPGVGRAIGKLSHPRGAGARAGAPLDIALPFASFEHRREGRCLADRLRPGDIRMLGFLADDRPGPFRLEIGSVGAAF